MAWVSPKVYAILSQSEEGKDIIERLPDLTQDECSAELDRFFNSASGDSSKDAFFEARKIEQEDEDLYHRIGDEEVSERDYEDEEESSTQDDVDARPNETKLLDMGIEEEKLQDMASRYLEEDKLKRLAEINDIEDINDLSADELIRSMSDDEIADMMRLNGLDEEIENEAENLEESKKKIIDEMKSNKFYSKTFENVFNYNKEKGGYEYTDSDKDFIIKMYENNDNPRAFVDEIQNTDMYKDMRAKASKIPQIDENDTERISKGAQELKDEITKGKTGDNFKKKQIVIVTGLPGAGKSSKEIKPFLENSIELDNDIAKKMPAFADSYQNGLGAGAVHMASKKAEKMVTQDLIKEGYNVVIPMIGDDEDSIFRRAQPFIEAGYDMPLLIHKEVSNDESRKRAFKRAIETGRFIYDEVLKKYGESANETHKRLKENNGVYVRDGKEYKFRIYEKEAH